ncbi:MAG TPA: ATP-binding cassette domain-containing protein [Flavobacteriales bacterium]|nr:ATP-binding cassette domain-containing protein [Flavobacteriales bacterium]
MEITLNEVGKRYNFNWIFNGLSWHIASGDRCVFLGANGSGKSTLLQIVAGSILSSAGKIQWRINEQEIEPEHVYQYVSIAAPYLELIEEFTLTELIHFHFSVKKSINNLSESEILQKSGLTHAADRRISYFSSGMKQRVRLILAILSDTPLLLLDEPLSNLDSRASEWYRALLEEFGGSRTILVSSNHQEPEYFFCNRRLLIEDFHRS